MTQCVYENQTDKWFIDMIEYNDVNCNDTIINKHQLPCLKERNCQCGKGMCHEDQIIRIQQNNEIFNDTMKKQEFEDSCIEKFKTIVFVKDQCISSKFIEYALQDASSSSSDSIESHDDDIEEWELKNQDYSVILTCDEELQQLSYHEYDDIECNGNPIWDEPEILIDVSDFPCVNIHC